MEPPRRTIARGPNPDDTASCVIAVPPDAVLCLEHGAQIAERHRSLGWCDDERCRPWGELDGTSPCAKPYTELRRSRPSSVQERNCVTKRKRKRKPSWQPEL